MTEPMVLDGIVYDADFVNGLKQPLLSVRDCLLEQGYFEHCIAFCHIHAVLDDYAKRIGSNVQPVTKYAP